MDVAILEWVHSQSNPSLDLVFRLSHELGSFRTSSVLVLALALWHAMRREASVALTWIVLGLAVGVLPEIAKELTARDRPALWTGQVISSGYSFPSGHATVGAAFYPFLAWMVSRAWPKVAWLAWSVGIALAALLGVGRLYLGVHWPSDVLAGWLLGAILAWGAIRWLSKPVPRGSHTSPG